MRRSIVIFVCAVLLPGLVLGALALRSLRDQEAAIEQERLRVLEESVERLASAVAARMDELQRDFSLRVESLTAGGSPLDSAATFDERLRSTWPPASLGFAVSLGGRVHSPPVLGSAEAREFLVFNEAFLCNSGSVEIFANTPKGRINLASLAPPDLLASQPAQGPATSSVPRAVTRRGQFAELIGNGQEGILARFHQDQLLVWVWYRNPRAPELVFGAQLDIGRLRADLGAMLPALAPRVPGAAFALLDDHDRPVAAVPEVSADRWRRPPVLRAIGPALPHWRVGAVVHDPLEAARTHRHARLTLTTIVVLLVSALAVGGWIVASDARRQFERARRRSDFVSSVSHELRTPLTSIRLFAELLEGDRVTDAGRRRHHLHVIQAEAARLQRLIANVLDFSRIERGEWRMRPDAIDLQATVRQVLDSFAPQLAAAGMTSRVRVSGEVPALRADRDALAQLVNNLVSNAVKYAAPGGEVDVGMASSGDRVTLEVQDRGPGIPEGLEERIFDEFFRADDALHSGVAGAGIGLTLARRIARAHGGDLTAHRREGGGARFVAELPAAPPTPA